LASQKAKSKPLNCPECGSIRLYKDGIRYTKTSQVQRYICRNCGYRFSDPNRQKTADSNSLNIPKQAQKIHTQILKRMDAIAYHRQICATQPLGAKNLAAALSEKEKQAAGATETTTDVKGKILEFAWWMKKQGYAESTVIGRTKLLKILSKRGADLCDPESVKEAIAKQKWSEGRKENAVEAYTLFLTMHGGKWDPPKYKRVRKLPFIPTEQELDALIASCGQKTAAFLQLLKETGIRAGEAWSLKWTDLDAEKRTVRITPEKGSEPRIFRISTKLMTMLTTLPKKTQFIFGGYPIGGFRRGYEKQRARAANKLGNPRLLQITFHTFRHWKATMEYHRTKDILYVMKLLGHKNIKNTLIYTQLINFEDDEYVCKVARTIEEAKQLIETGFEYVCDVDGAKLFRKRK